MEREADTTMSWSRRQLELLATALEADTAHTLPVGDWADFLALAFPKEYRAPRPRTPATSCSRTQRLAVLEARARRGEQLHHPDDTVQQHRPEAGEPRAGPRQSRSVL